MKKEIIIRECQFVKLRFLKGRLLGWLHFQWNTARELLWKPVCSLVDVWGSLPCSLPRVRGYKLAELLRRCLTPFKLMFTRNPVIKHSFLQGALCFISLKRLEIMFSMLWRHPINRQEFKVFQKFNLRNWQILHTVASVTDKKLKISEEQLDNHIPK